MNQYNLAEDADKKAHFARLMAKCIARAPANGFTVEQVTQQQLYPIGEVARYLSETEKDDAEPDITEGQAISAVAHAVDVSDVLRLVDGI